LHAAHHDDGPHTEREREREREGEREGEMRGSTALSVSGGEMRHGHLLYLHCTQYRRLREHRLKHDANLAL
jgi:hypothetical protein